MSNNANKPPPGWERNHVYTVGDLVKAFPNAATWECLINHTSGNRSFIDDRNVHPNYWRVVKQGSQPG